MNTWDSSLQRSSKIFCFFKIFHKKCQSYPRQNWSISTKAMQCEEKFDCVLVLVYCDINQEPLHWTLNIRFPTKCQFLLQIEFQRDNKKIFRSFYTNLKKMCSAKNCVAAVSCPICDVSVLGVGARAMAAHVAMHAPWATLQAKIAAGTPTPPVITSAVPPRTMISK